MTNQKNQTMHAEDLYELEIAEEPSIDARLWQRFGRVAKFLGAAAVCYVGLVTVIVVIATITHS